VRTGPATPDGRDFRKLTKGLTVKNYVELIKEARKAAAAVYLATDAAVADDLSRIINNLADALENK